MENLVFSYESRFPHWNFSCLENFGFEPLYHPFLLSPNGECCVGNVETELCTGFRSTPFSKLKVRMEKFDFGFESVFSPYSASRLKLLMENLGFGFESGYNPHYLLNMDSFVLEVWRLCTWTLPFLSNGSVIRMLIRFRCSYSCVWISLILQWSPCNIFVCPMNGDSTSAYWFTLIKKIKFTFRHQNVGNVNHLDFYYVIF